MTKKSKTGICKLCGKETELTFEHVPPRSAFNDKTINIYRGEDIFDYIKCDEVDKIDMMNVKHKISQKGSGDYYLCASCNNFIGAKYNNEYCRLLYGLVKFIAESFELEELIEDNEISLNSEEFDSMAVFKQIMAMFCDISPICYNDKELREFILNENSTAFNFQKYQLFAFIALGPHSRTMGSSTLLIKTRQGDLKIVQCAEISAYPIGFQLYVSDEQDVFELDIKEQNITQFAKYPYGSKHSFNLSLKIHNIPPTPFTFGK